MLPMLNAEAVAPWRPIEKTNLKKAKFIVGDTVLMSNVKTLFKKCCKDKYSNKVFKAAAVARPKNTSTDPVSYHLKGSRGDNIQVRFYNQELVTFRCNISQHRPSHQTLYGHSFSIDWK